MSFVRDADVDKRKQIQREKRGASWTYTKVDVEAGLRKVGDGVSLYTGLNADSAMTTLCLRIDQDVSQSVRIAKQDAEVRNSLQAWLDDTLITPPGFTAARDDIITRESGQYAVRNLVLVSALLVDVLVLENLSDVRRAMDEEIPSSCKEDFGGAVLSDGLLDVSVERVLLVDIFDEGQQGNPKGDGGDSANVWQRKQETAQGKSDGDNGEDEQDEQDEQVKHGRWDKWDKAWADHEGHGRKQSIAQENGQK